MMKKWASYLMLIVLLMSVIPMNVVEATVDVTKPTFQSIEVDKKEVQVGDEIIITLKASDVESGINRVYLSYSAPQTDNEKIIFMSYDVEQDVYVARIRMEENMPSGIWKPRSLLISDNAGNSLYMNRYDNVFDNEAEFELIGTSADVKKPVFESMSIDKKEVQVGDEATITLKVSDVGSGINRVYLSYSAPQTDNEKIIFMSYDVEQDVYVARIRMEENMPSGIWKPRSLLISDNAGNSLYMNRYDNVFDNEAEFELIGTSADVKKPVFESMSIDKKEVQVGDEATITLKASDVGSGINRVYLSYSAPQTDNEKIIFMSYDVEQDVYVARIRMEENMPSGIWKPRSLLISDNAGNSLYMNRYDNTFGNEGEFFLKDYSKDRVSPVFKSFSLSQPFLDQTESLEMKVKATDDTKVKYVKVTSRHSDSKKEQLTTLYPSEERDEYQASIQLIDNLEAGQWTISSIEVEDINGNKTLVTEGLNEYTFTVFPRIQTLGKTFYTENTSLMYTTISGDVYIGPQAVISLSGTTIYGNVYVLGAMRSYGGLRVTGTIYANSFSFGSSSLYQGGVVFSGSNSFSGMVASNDPLNRNIPFKLYEDPIVETDGKVTLSGATVPVVDVTLEGEKLNINTDGTFRVKDYPIGIKRKLTFGFQDIFGNAWTKTYDVFDRSKPVVTPSLSSGIYIKGKILSLNATKNAKIYYTTDGSDPTDMSQAFNGETEVHEGVNLKYVAIDALNIQSDVGELNLYTYEVDPFLEESNTIKGTGTQGMNVSVLKDGKSIANTVIDSSGQFKMKVDQQKVGTRLVVRFEINGLENDEYNFVVEDHIAPLLKLPLETTDDVLQLKGESEVGATITIYENESKDKQLGKGTTGIDGKFSISFERPSGNALYVVATDASGNASKPQKVTLKDVTAPTIKLPVETSDDVLQLKGESESGSTVTIYDTESKEKQLGKGTTGVDGKFSISFERPSGNALYVVSTDISGNASKPQKVMLKDVTAPTMRLPVETSDDVLQLKGESESGSTVTIYDTESKEKQLGKGTTGVDGKFSIAFERPSGNALYVVASDTSGNASKPQKVLLKDVVPPAKPFVDQVTNRSTTVTGQAEPGAMITMLIGETTVEFRTDASGRFSHPVSQLLAGTMISFRASDASNNQSEAVEQRVSDVIKPILSGVTNQTIAWGQVFNPLYKVIANDETDGNLTSKIKTTGTVDSKRSGVYTITYAVVDRAGNLTKVNRLITVRDTVNPTISGVGNVTIGLNQKFDVRKNVTAKDNVDGTLTKAIKITGSINVNKVGTYNLTYSVSDKAGNKTTIIRKVTVKDLTKPVLSGVATKTVKYKTSFNPMAGVSAKDNLDGSLTKKIKVSGTVNTKKKGSYYLTYRVEDKSGNLTIVKRKITVK